MNRGSVHVKVSSTQIQVAISQCHFPQLLVASFQFILPSNNTFNLHCTSPFTTEFMGYDLGKVMAIVEQLQSTKQKLNKEKNQLVHSTFQTDCLSEQVGQGLPNKSYFHKNI